MFDDDDFEEYYKRRHGDSGVITAEKLLVLAILVGIAYGLVREYINSMVQISDEYMHTLIVYDFKLSRRYMLLGQQAIEAQQYFRNLSKASGNPPPSLLKKLLLLCIGIRV